MSERRRLFFSRRALLLVAAPVFLAALCIAAGFFYFDAQVEAILGERQAAIVDSEVRLLELVDKEEGLASLSRTVARRTSIPNDDFAIQALVDRDNKYLAGDVDWPQDVVADGEWRPIETYARNGAHILGHGRALVLPDGAKVLVGRDQTAQRTVEAAVGEVLLTVLSALLAVTVGAGVLLNKFVLLRIDRIASTARRIIAGALGERVPETGQDSEFDHLSAVLNSMLARNEAHIEQMRVVTDSIAHDLRLPLQRVKADLERAQASSNETERHQSFQRAGAEIDEALSTFNALLDITRAEAGLGRENFEDLDLKSLTEDMIELFAPVAEDRHQTLGAELDDAHMRGQSTLLRRAIANLLENAIKFSPEKSAIFVRLKTPPSLVRLIVEDNGPGIPVSERETAMRPFSHLSRDDAVAGKGLGLALVVAVAKLHAGTLRLEGAEPGLRAILDFPAAGPQS